MSAATAASIVALRPALEALVVKATVSPESVAEPTAADTQLLNIVRTLSKANAARHGVQAGDGAATGDG